MIPPCLTLSIITYRSTVKWSNPEKGIAPTSTPRCCHYWKGSLWVTLDYGHQQHLLFVSFFSFFNLILFMPDLILCMFFFFLYRGWYMAHANHGHRPNLGWEWRIDAATTGEQPEPKLSRQCTVAGPSLYGLRLWGYEDWPPKQ